MSTIEWVPEDDWSKVKTGDRVKFTADAGALQGELAYINPSRRAAIIRGLGIELRGEQWSLFVEAPKVTLPTEPGYYIGYDKLAEKEFIAEWRDGSLWFGWPTQSKLGDPERFAPFTRLEPRHETVAAVLDRLSSWWEFGPPKAWAEEFAQVAAEFGAPQ